MLGSLQLWSFFKDTLHHLTLGNSTEKLWQGRVLQWVPQWFSLGDVLTLNLTFYFHPQVFRGYYVRDVRPLWACRLFFFLARHTARLAAAFPPKWRDSKNTSKDI